TKHYSIRPNLGNLMIQKRSITLTSPSLSKTYDGTAIANYDDSDPFLHENQGVEVGGDGLALYSGDYLKVTFQNVGKYHAGTYQNSFNYKICRMVQGEEVDVENNYNVSTAFGTLTINKKPLTYTVDSQQFDYDGTAHTSILPTHSGLAAGDAITFTPKATITKPSEGSVQATFDVSISNGGESRTSDYQITAGNIGSLSVKKRAITVQFHDLTNAYNGETYRLDDSPSKYDLGGDPLILDHTLDVSGGKSLKDVGSISDAPTVKVRDSSGNDVSSEYDISVLPGTITVTKAPLTVTVDPVEATFGDGGGSGANYSSYSVTSDLATGDTFNPVFGSGQIHHTAGTKLSFGYKITNASGADVTNNYKALVEGENLTLGSVVVHKRAVSLTPVFSGSNQKQYDGTPLVPSSISADNLAAGDHLENTYEFLDCPSQYTDTPQVVSIKADSVKIVNSTGSDVTDDYDITLNTTTAQILKRSLTCNIQSATQEIDSSLTVKKTFSNLLPGETIDEANLNWTISAGMVTLDESSLIIRNGNNDVTTSN
ncbi:MAG: hypothetical protein J5736_02000, partial [Bacilli bacterium]|nr:hypothetical protein [Bacilli bacterium]